jgi:hypothetical protein
MPPGPVRDFKLHIHIEVPASPTREAGLPNRKIPMSYGQLATPFCSTGFASAEQSESMIPSPAPSGLHATRTLRDFDAQGGMAGSGSLSGLDNMADGESINRRSDRR